MKRLPYNLLMLIRIILHSVFAFELLHKIQKKTECQRYINKLQVSLPPFALFTISKYASVIYLRLVLSYENETTEMRPNSRKIWFGKAYLKDSNWASSCWWHKISIHLKNLNIKVINQLRSTYFSILLNLPPLEKRL